jgi:hypothetical protein
MKSTEGSPTREGLETVCEKPSHAQLCLCRSGFRKRCEGCEGLARVYTCEGGRGRHGRGVRWQGGTEKERDSGVTRKNPLYPRVFFLTN